MAEAAPATSGTPTPPPPQANGAASTSAGAPAWYGDLTAKPELAQWVQGKNFADPATALEAYRNTERMIGVPADQIIRKPKDANDTAGIAAYRQALGVPEKAEGYEIPVPEGQATTLRDWAAPTFLKLGVPAEMAKGIATEWNSFLEGQVKAGEEADRVALAAAETTLRSEWGNQYEANSELARRAFTQFAKASGMGDAAAHLDSVMGVAGSIKLWNAIGKAMGEGTFKTGDPTPVTLTPADASAKLALLRSDKGWMQAFLSGDKTKQLEKMQLDAIISGDDTGLKLLQSQMGIRT